MHRRKFPQLLGLSSVLYFRSDEGLTLEMSALKLFTVANLHYNLVDKTKVTLLLPPTQHHCFSLETYHLYFLSTVRFYNGCTNKSFTSSSSFTASLICGESMDCCSRMWGATPQYCISTTLLATFQVWASETVTSRFVPTVISYPAVSYPVKSIRTQSAKSFHTHTNKARFHVK